MQVGALEKTYKCTSLKLGNVKRLFKSTIEWIIKMYKGHTGVSTVGNDICLLFKTGIGFT